jgi:hypothetical protein
LRAAVEELAVRHDRSVSGELRCALREYVAEQQCGREPGGSLDRAAAELRERLGKEGRVSRSS